MKSWVFRRPWHVDKRRRKILVPTKEWGLCGVGAVESESGDSGTYVTNLTAGAGYAVIWVQTGPDVSVPSVSDDLGNLWVKSVNTNVSRQAAIFTTVCTSPGTATITCSIGASTTWKWMIMAVCPRMPWQQVSISNTVGINEDVSGTSHFCAASTGFNVAADSTIVGCSSAGAASGGFTAGTSGSTTYREWANDADLGAFSGYTPFAMTNERVPFSTGNSIATTACCVAFNFTLAPEYSWAANSAGITHVYPPLISDPTIVLPY